MFSSKNKSHFTPPVTLSRLESAGALSHAVGKAKKRIPARLAVLDEASLPEKYKYLWYLKKEPDKAVARREVFAQELFRLLIPGHTKTRLVIDERGDTFVASKHIPGYTRLPNDLTSNVNIKREWNAKLKNGTYTGLGELTTISLLLNEVDLKNGNIALNDKNQLIKFDGDWCFARLRAWSGNNITEHEIDMLPFPGNYKPYNWLGIVAENVRRPHPLLDSDISTNPRFRAEVNHALLKALILPEALIKNFIAAYIEDATEATTLYNEFTDRRNQLAAAAFKNNSFLAYLKQLKQSSSWKPTWTI